MDPPNTSLSEGAIGSISRNDLRFIGYLKVESIELRFPNHHESSLDTNNGFLDIPCRMLLRSGILLFTLFLALDFLVGCP